MWSRVRAPVLSSAFHQGRLGSNDNGSPWSAGRTRRLGGEDVAAASGNTRKPTGSCAADCESPGLPLISPQPSTHRRTGTGADRTLWRSQSSVTDKAIIALLCAFKAIIKCDRVCPDATPTERWWGVYPQQFMTGEADGGDTHKIIAFSFQQPKKESGNRLSSYTKQIMPLPAGEIWQLFVIHDTYWHRNVYIPWGRREGKNVSMLKIWCRLQASPTAMGATFMCSTDQTKHPFLVKPFNLSSWNTCPLGESQLSGEEKCFYFGILEINHDFLLMITPSMSWETSAQLPLMCFYLSLRWSLMNNSLSRCLLSMLTWIRIT